MRGWDIHANCHKLWHGQPSIADRIPPVIDPMRIIIFAHPTCIRHPRQRSPCQNTAIRFSTEKLEWCGYPILKIFWRRLYSFQQNTWTWWMDTAWQHRQRLCNA